MPKRDIKNKRRAGKRLGKRMSFAQRVQSVINKSQETKKAVYETSLTSIDASINNTADALRIMPPIFQGTDSFQRNGQSVRLMKVVIRGYFQLPASQSGSSEARLMIRQMYLKNKQYNDWRNMTSPEFADLLEGVGSAGATFDGSAQRYMTPINREKFTSRGDNKFKMLTNQYFTSNGVAEQHTASVRYFSKTLTFGKNGKILYFEDENSGTPFNFPYFMSVGYAKVDGTAITSNLVSLAYSATAYYKDA